MSDILVRSTSIFDGLKDEPFSGFVAIKGDKILDIGEGTGEYHITKATKIIDAGDQTVTPGFHDSHVHLIIAGLFQVYANLLHAKSEEETALMVKEAADKSPDKTGWVYGFSWYHIFWDKKELPHKETLDRYFPDRPVFLMNWEAHGAWANSKALEMAGITDETPDPFGGRIQRDEKGEATGFLYESAVGLVSKHAYQFSKEQEKALLKSFMKKANSYGITSVTDVQPYFHGNMGSLDVYSDLDKNDELTVRIHAAPDLLGDLDEVCEWREKYNSDKLRVDNLKQFIDGVPTTHTGLLLDDYTDAPGEKGICLNDLEKIGKAVPEAHKRGLSVKLHSCGDGSMRTALDFYEDAIKKYGKNECRHAVEHCEMISDADMKRFSEMAIVASIQPDAIAMTQTFEDNPYPVVLGKERADKTWPFKDYLDKTGVLAMGTDCPVMDTNPFYQLYRAVTRVHNDGEPKGGWNPSQKLTKSEALKGYTWGSAYASRRENEIGSLSKGKFADLAIINRNYFECSESEIYEAAVDLTIMNGNIVYDSGKLSIRSREEKRA